MVCVMIGESGIVIQVRQEIPQSTHFVFLFFWFLGWGRAHTSS